MCKKKKKKEKRENETIYLVNLEKKDVFSMNGMWKCLWDVLESQDGKIEEAAA